MTDRGASSAPGTSSGNDQKTIAPVTGDATTLFMADQYSLCAPKMIGLSYNWSAMTSLVNGLTPNGNTNQPIGLVWGWQSLVGGGPFTAPALDSNYKYKQVIILLSDGLNTQDRWYGDGTTTNTSVDNRMYNSSGNRHLRATSRPPASRSIPSRSTPAAIRPRRCCRTAPAHRTSFSCSPRRTRS